MKKFKLFIDTSVISHLESPDAPEKMRDTLKLWNEIKSGVYDIAISDIVIEEIMRCPQPKLGVLLGFKRCEGGNKSFGIQ